MSTRLVTCPSCSIQYQISGSDIGPTGRQVRCVECQEMWFVPGEPVIDPDLYALEDNIASEDRPSNPVTNLHNGADVSGPANNDALHNTPMPAPAPRTHQVIDQEPETFEPEKSEPESAKPDSVGSALAGQVSAPVGADVLIRDQADAARLARRRRTIFIIWMVPLFLVILFAILAFIYRQPIVNRVPQTATLFNAMGFDVRETGLMIDPPIAKTAQQDGRTVIMIEGQVRNISGRTQTVPLIEMTLHDGAGETLTQWFVEPARATLDARERLAFQTQYEDPPGGVVGLRYRFVERS